VTRSGNTHKYFAPVSVFKTKNGYVYIAVGNERQWKAFVSIPQFQFLDRPEYEKNEERIHDVVNLNRSIGEAFETLTSEELIETFNKAGIPISNINTIPEVLGDPLIKRRLLTSRDSKSGIELTLAPPPYRTPFLAENENRLSFPPRFGEHNKEIYGDILGYSEGEVARFKEEGIL